MPAYIESDRSPVSPVLGLSLLAHVVLLQTDMSETHMSLRSFLEATGANAAALASELTAYAHGVMAEVCFDSPHERSVASVERASRAIVAARALRGL
jgi:hypothetical protein